MPLLGWAKLRLGSGLGPAPPPARASRTSCAQSRPRPRSSRVAGAGIGLSFLDPIAALVVAAIAARESIELWQGEADDCCAPIGFTDPTGHACGCDDGCDCC